jgi:hypothetical protein
VVRPSTVQSGQDQVWMVKVGVGSCMARVCVCWVQGMHVCLWSWARVAFSQADDLHGLETIVREGRPLAKEEVAAKHGTSSRVGVGKGRSG